MKEITKTTSKQLARKKVMVAPCQGTEKGNVW